MRLPASTAVDTPEPAPSNTPRLASLRIADRRVHLALGWPQLTVLGVLLLVMLVATFQAGVQSGRPSPAGSDDLNRLLLTGSDTDTPAGDPVALPPGHRPPDGAVTPGRPGGGETTPTRVAAGGPEKERPAEPNVFQSGHFYVVIQYFQKRKPQDAEAARDFLRSKGVECVVQARSRDIMLVATEPFPDARQAQSLAKRVRTLGKEYSPIGGYNFDGCEPLKF